ncbi:hypothetical protein [Thalassotalea maritima]|uniref:hypothetical protein n=1 Tax=Thalassotalea maritima TaxID=3242416 RepID=UPI003526CCDB
MLTGHFIDSAQGKIFVTQFGSFAGQTAILCLPSIFEEMNLSRAVIANQARRFAANFPCVVMDYVGTGDSEGELVDVDVSIWQQDIINVCHWLVSQGITKVVLWGVRFGALIAASIEDRIKAAMDITSVILWKPVINGTIFMGQFIRIKQMNELMNTGAKNINWREHILQGKEVEISGYLISSQLLTSIEALKLSPPLFTGIDTHWFELASASISPAVDKIVSDAENIDVKAVPSQAFWQTPEIYEQPSLYLLHQLIINNSVNYERERDSIFL